MQPTVMFTPVQYTLATEEAERIGVDHIARSSVTGSAQTSAGMHSDILSLSLYPMFSFLCTVAEQLSAQHGAVKMLHSRVRLLLDYLKAVQAGKRLFM